MIYQILVCYQKAENTNNSQSLEFQQVVALNGDGVLSGAYKIRDGTLFLTN
jgi:hypothetical protein